MSRKKSEEFLILADAVHAMIWMSNPARSHTLYNKHHVRFVGDDKMRDGLHDRLDFMHPDDRERYLLAYTAALSTRMAFEIHYRLRRHDGKYRVIREWCSPKMETDGRLSGYVGLCIDVSDQQALERDFRLTANLRSIGQVAADQVCRYNDILEQILGHSRRLLRDELPNAAKSNVRAIQSSTEKAIANAQQISKLMAIFSGEEISSSCP